MGQPNGLEIDINVACKQIKHFYSLMTWIAITLGISRPLLTQMEVDPSEDQRSVHFDWYYLIGKGSGFVPFGGNMPHVCPNLTSLMSRWARNRTNLGVFTSVISNQEWTLPFS